MSRYRSLVAEPLTRAAFAPFGDVIDADGAESFSINQGRTERFHALSAVALSCASDRVVLSIFRGQPLAPLEIALMERHPLGSQSFMPINSADFLAVVAPPGDFDEAAVRVFLVKGHQGVTYHAGTWHAPLLPLTADADYLVVDRQGLGQNCDEVDLQQSIKPILAAG